MNVSILGRLRSNAMAEPDALMAFNLRKTADDLQIAIKAFNEMSSEQNLAAVTGLWARAVRYLCLSEHGPDDSGPGTGLKEPARLAA